MTTREEPRAVPTTAASSQLSGDPAPTGWHPGPTSGGALPDAGPAPAPTPFRELDRRWWLWPVIAFVLTRLFDGALIVLASRHQIALDGSIHDYKVSIPTPASPGYLGVATNWDAQWFAAVAQHGYPSALPVQDGMVWRNEWAFAPLYPLTVRGLMAVTGASFPVVATVVTVLCSLVAVVLVHRLVAETAGRFPARATSLLLCTSMAAPVLQVAYTEGPALLFIASALLLLRRRRYALTVLALLGLGLTRHVVAPFVVVLVVVAVVERRRLGRWEARSLATLAAGVAITGLWPLVAAVATGHLDAFTATQRAWRNHPATTGPLGLFSVGDELAGATGVLVVAVVLAAILWLVLRRDGPAWGPELRAWAAAYPTYLFAVAPAAISIFRLMLLAFPLFWVLPNRVPVPWAHRVTLGVLAATGLYLQWYWIRYFLVIGPISQQFAMP
ncbi:mannosyltransferase family protein [Pedococcus sp. NPDC057267]|uniref:mannosyltransferase family protein n=1 Tax=Pedococcus sp. NPDC057267 TaxID=3346077 RepID=UPI00363247C8